MVGNIYIVSHEDVLQWNNCSKRSQIKHLYVMNIVMTYVVKSRIYSKIKMFHEYFFSVQEKLLWLFKLYDKVRNNSCFDNQDF